MARTTEIFYKELAILLQLALLDKVYKPVVERGGGGMGMEYKNVLYGEASPQGPHPDGQPLFPIFDRKGNSFIYLS